MFQSILRSLSGSFADLGKWEPTADRSEVALRSGLEKSLLFVLCSSAIMGISAMTLGISQQPIYCDRGLAFWNGLLGAILLTLAAACSAALFFETQAVKLMAKLIWTNCESSFFEFGSTAFNVAACVAACPIVALLWIMRGYVDLTSSPTCRNTAALLYGGSLTNIALTVSALSFAALMISYYVASSKRFYDIAILSCICDPISIAVEGVAERLPEPPRIRFPEFVPSLDECVAKLPSYENTRAFVKRLVDAITPVSLPHRVYSLMETRVY
ncbi:hypothetical protein, conserved [Eimeria necatrix]|uniref:Transmembrane protein n=1 Tax=Eimeria necatrix TaxID=51315 RepID=U6MK66_9EIME|nr:hypothetical protein, conserved [Eimeria necatrix]CDJ62864.1 hypothetical protein, conserved [Eimeria necatrix]